MVSKQVQALVRKALQKALTEPHPHPRASLLDGAFDAAIDTAPRRPARSRRLAPTADARQAIAALIDQLNGCYALLNTRFQSAIAVPDYAAADALKTVMDTVALTLVGLQREVVALYEADADAAATALAPVIADLDAVREGTGTDTEVAGRVKTVLGALTAVLGLV